jgi:alpha-galactosidase
LEEAPGHFQASSTQENEHRSALDFSRDLPKTLFSPGKIFGPCFNNVARGFPSLPIQLSDTASPLIRKLSHGRGKGGRRKKPGPKFFEPVTTMTMKIHKHLSMRLAASAALILAVPSATAENPVPAVIPKYDGKPAAKDKPVKLYIFSGQSNSLGFGRAEGGELHYSSILLSADPAIQPARMPVGNSGILPHHVFASKDGSQKGATAKIFKGEYDANADYGKMTPVQITHVALGDVTAEIPSIDGPHTTVVEAYLEVPMAGMHEIHAGYGDSEQAVVRVNGQEVYRKLTEEPATMTRIKLEAGKRHPVTIHYTKGGKAAFWMELVGLQPRGSLRYMIEEKGMFPNLLDENGEWIVRGDAHVNNTYMGKGSDSPFSPMWRNGTFGPEVGFGSVIATYHDEPVILMKVDIGNRSLGWDILPPGSEAVEVNGEKVPGYKQKKDKEGNVIDWTGEGWYAGKQYDEYTGSIHHLLDNFAEIYPQYADQGYQIAGFVWWQGHKDQNEIHASLYARNFANLVKAWGKEFNAPDAPWVLATIAFEGWNLSGPGKKVAEAQLSVDGDAGVFPEHKGKVKTIEARDFWRDPGESPKNQGYHYNHNGETYFLVGDALGRAMVELQGGKAEPRQHPERDEVPAIWPEDPTLAQAAQMLYTQEFMSPWAKGPNKPTRKEMDAIAPALKPFIIGSLIPEYIQNRIYIPAYQRKGVWAAMIVSGEAPDTRTRKQPILDSSGLDDLINYYQTVGIDEYSWKPFGPEMRTAEWDYYSFTPAEPATAKDKTQYREVKMPEGMEDWFATDFDAAKAGWETGRAPFGQNDGKQTALMPTCTNPQCRCDVTPNTLWKDDALFIRQTFDVPELKEGHRYRLVVGGGNHGWAGEGFAVYLNGKLFAEERNAKFKKGGTSGMYFFNDFLPDLKSGKITVAVHSFLRRSGNKGKSAPPKGHLSIWLEEAKLPPALIAEVKRRESGQ